MEKKSWYLFLFLSYSLISCAVQAASARCVKNGAITQCFDGTLENLQVAGKASLLGTTVLGDTHVSGLLHAKTADLNQLHVAGKAQLFRTQVHGETRVSGKLDAQQSQFNNKIYLATDITHLKQTSTRAILFTRNPKPEVLCLSRGSLVNGDVTFDSNRGKVVVDQSSQVKGRIIGGYLSYEFSNYCKGDNL